ncbi:hypothetical protein LINPERPRIM_LOCUS3792 [Linum perenne]
MAAFTMGSDKLFIKAEHNGQSILVYEYEDETNIIGMIHARCPRWKLLARIPVNDPTKSPYNYGTTPPICSGVEVQGVTISGGSLMTLVSDLCIRRKDGRILQPMVNRQGVCLIDMGEGDPICWLRINGYFCWSKYVASQVNLDVSPLSITYGAG